MNNKAERGAKIIINEWANLDKNEKLLIVSDSSHIKEAELLQHEANKINGYTDILIAEDSGKLIGIFFDENDDAFLEYDIIIAATNYSLVTTSAARKAIKSGKKFLSIPLHTNNNISMLEYNFILMDTKTSKKWAEKLISPLNKSETIKVTTKLGTDMTFYKKGRPAKFFNGNVDICDGYASSSFEVYVPIEERKTQGTLVLDGSFGYIGKVTKPLKIKFKDGKIVNIPNTKEGNILSDFISSYNDENMYVTSEFGIGLNALAKCDGNCYIEDESTLGTFHIGFGRNLALGGILEANGHFDLTTFAPDIYADNVKIMEKGQIIF